LKLENNNKYQERQDDFLKIL